MIPTRLRRSLGAAAVAVLAAGLLTACSPDQVGSAAIIDGQRISTDSLQQATREYLKAVGSPDDRQAQRRVLEQMILARVVDRAAKEADVGVRRGTVARQRDGVLRDVGGKVALVRALAQAQSPTAVPPSQIDSWVRFRLQINRLLAKADPGGDPTSQIAVDNFRKIVVRTSRGMDIELNPRYGTWSPTRGLRPLISGGLSQTAAQLTGD